MNNAHRRMSESDIEAIKQAVDLAALIGATVALRRQGDEWVGLCPFHAEKTPSFNVIPNKRMYFCFGCGATGDAISWVRWRDRCGFTEAAERLGAERGQYTPAKVSAQPTPSVPTAAEEAKMQRKIDRCREIWRHSLPAQGTPVEKYLASRGLSGMMIPPSLRFHPRVWHTEGQDFYPAMIGCVMDPSGRHITGVHRTYLAPDGRGKAVIPYLAPDGTQHTASVKKMMGKCRGSHVWMSTVSDGRLAVAEGIETALSVMKACPGLAVWAAMSLSNMSAPVPPGVTELILCADGDNKDPSSADNQLIRAARALHCEGRAIRIARPDQGKDFNDMLGRAA